MVKILFFIPTTVDKFIYSHTYNTAKYLSEYSQDITVGFFGIPVVEMIPMYDNRFFNPLKDFAHRHSRQLKKYSIIGKRDVLLDIKSLFNHFFYSFIFLKQIFFYDIVYLRNGFSYFVPYAFLAKLFHKKVIIESNTIAESEFYILNKIYNYFLKKSDLVLVQGKELLDVTVSGGVLPSRVVNLENGVDTVAFKYSEPLDIKINGQIVSLYVGSLDKIHSLSRVMDFVIDIPNLKLCIVGDGPNQSTIVQVASNNDSIEYYGYIPHNQVSKKIAESHFCFATFNKDLSKHKKYGFCFSSLKIFEYLAVGRPVFVNAKNLLIEELIEEGVAFYFETANDISRVISRFQCDNKDYRSVCLRAREIAERFDWQNNLKELYLCIKNI